ncbi:MAG: pectate lyase [Candidatus Sumerlaeota bacterium]|nr:pectate lyase [Candidatus Sumerlaeota bacterium]
MMKKRISLAFMLFIMAAAGDAFAKGGAARYLKKPEAWFAGDEAKRIAANILSWQSNLGGWPKNEDTVAQPYAGKDREKDLKPTFDNGATTDEMRFLARILAASKDARYKDAFLRGLDYILKAQYTTGGWPQFYPPSKQYHRHITFNDNAMVRLMEFLREIYSSPLYAFVNEERKNIAREEFDKGIQCILKCQIKVDGKLTAWCAQHDEKDYSPRPGRAYELASLSGAESIGIARLLMSLDNPSTEVIRTIEGAVAWFEAAKLRGIKVVEVEDKNTPGGKDKRVVEDASAPPLWARFYEIATNKPIFCDRDGVAKHKLSEIGYERRNGYSWLGAWPQTLLEKEYPSWKKKWEAKIGLK